MNADEWQTLHMKKGYAVLRRTGLNMRKNVKGER